MRGKLLTVVALLILCAVNNTAMAQCVPPAPTGNAGIYPDPDNIPCINQGEFYSEVLFLENVGSFNLGGFTGIGVDTLVIDSIVNLPCNLNWIANGGTNKFFKGETGCIRVYGITDDSVGQYKLKVYVKAYITVIGLQQGEISEIIEGIESLINVNLGIDFNFWLRVKDAGAACPAIIRNDTTVNLTAQNACIVPNEISVSAGIDTTLCSGDTLMLGATTSNMFNPVFHWTPGSLAIDSSAQNPEVTPTETTNFVVSVTDSNGIGNTTYDVVTVNVANSVLSADFNVQLPNVGGVSASFEPLSPGAYSYTWDFGDNTTSMVRTPVHTFPDTGSYDVSLTVVNICGANTFTKTIEVGVDTSMVVDTSDTTTHVFEAMLLDDSLVSVWPNPASGAVTVQTNGLEQLAAVQIIDLTGKRVSYYEQIGSTAKQIDISTLNAGIYLVRAETESGTLSAFEKLIVTK